MMSQENRAVAGRLFVRNGGARALMVGLLILVGGSTATASSLKISAGSANARVNEVEADYSTSHIFVDEVAGESVPITVFFDPQVLGVESAEVFTNLNRRDRATGDADHDGVEDGIMPPSGNRIAAGDDANYYKAETMANVAGGYQLTLRASRCGAYRLTARYRLNGDPPGTFRWYGAETNAQGILKRDHALVISPKKARNIQLYEVNPLTIIATGTKPDQRGTFADLADGLPPASGPRFSLNYAKQLGCNTLWLLPIHADGIDGRLVDPKTNQPYAVGSPYAVKNFFSVMPLMAKGFTPGDTPAANDTPAGRTLALGQFRAFVQAADAQGVDIMLDAPFNHAAHDVELAPTGQKYWGNGGTSPTTEVRAVEARFFSRTNAYDLRASGAQNIALAPDRFDFGKWPDVFDIYFGRYAALVANPSQTANYTNPGDWFDYSVGQENSEGQGNGHFDALTQNVWRYFGDYLEFWLTQTGYPENAEHKALDSAVGVDCLRADFGQGLPPQCWEYLINRGRSRKWNLVFMAESLDGGAVTYRSCRHFDVLNENLIYALHHAQQTSDFRALYDARHQSYGAGLVLLNTSSHDEDNYRDPFEGVLRMMVNSTNDGALGISAGQEQGLRGTIVPPGDGDPNAGPAFGYDLYEINFGKPIPQFKTFNSMMPLWRDAADPNSISRHVHNLFSAVGQARHASPALRGANRFYLNLKNNTPHEQIYSVATFERRNATPDAGDVVFAFVNLTVGGDAATPAGNAFNVNVDADGDGTNDFGIKPGRMYNVKNIAAYTGADPNRRDAFLWPNGRSGSDLLTNGLPISLNRVPTTPNGWSQAPYEAQFLKLFDVSP